MVKGFALMLSAFWMMLSDFLGLGAARRPKGDWGQRAPKNRRPDCGAEAPYAYAMDGIGVGGALMYGE